MPEEKKIAQAVIVDPIKDAIRRSNEAERARKRKVAEVAAGPFIAEYKDRVAKVEAENATLSETCKSLQNSNEALRSANELLQKRIAALESGNAEESTPVVDPAEDGGKKVRGKKA